MTRDRALLIGCNGGVGRAVQALLASSAPGRRLAKRLDAVVLADAEPDTQARPLAGSIALPPIEVRSADDLERLVREHRITQVVDVASTDTLECTRRCAELGVNFLSTSVEEWPNPSPIPTDEAIARLLPPTRPQLPGSHLIGSGANPGMVNALAFAAIRAFANEVGVEPDPEALDLHALFITEEDTTAERRGKPANDVFQMTWSPRHCLDELFESRTFAARGGEVAPLGHAPVERWYRVRCGESVIEGMAVPHEEVLTLARRFPGLQIAFVYRIAEAARHALATHPERTRSEQWKTRRLLPPWTRFLAGEDRLGVLLCSRRYGEFWLGFRTDVATGLALGTNATELQVAAGVIAGWSQLGSREGIHFVEDLDVDEFLGAASEVLGEPQKVYDADAPVRTLAQRSRVNTAALAPVAAARARPLRTG